jgi:hypothetical protein
MQSSCKLQAHFSAANPLGASISKQPSKQQTKLLKKHQHPTAVWFNHKGDRYETKRVKIFP